MAAATFGDASPRLSPIQYDSQPVLQACCARPLNRRGRRTWLQGLVSFDLRVVVQDSVQQRTIDLDFSVVIDQAQFSKFIHEKADAGSGRADHLRQGALADIRLDRLRTALLAEVRQQKQKTRQTLFTRIKQLVDQVLFDTAIPGEEIGDKHFREL